MEKETVRKKSPSKKKEGKDKKDEVIVPEPSDAELTKSELTEIKREVRALEKENLSKIIAFRSTKGWWKLGGPSALFYKRTRSTKLGKDTKVRGDRDRFCTFKEGTVSVNNIRGFAKEMERMGLDFVPEESTEYRRVFKLKMAFSEGDLKLMRKEQAAFKEALRADLVPNMAFPEIWSGLEQVAKMAYTNMRKDPELEREIFSIEFVKIANKAWEDYVGGCRDNMVSREVLAATGRTVKLLTRKLYIIGESGVWDEGKCTRMSEVLINLLAQIKRRYIEVVEREKMRGNK